MLAGAAIGNGNRGVEALGRTVIDALERHGGVASLAVLDDGWGVRPTADDRYRHLRVEYVGVRRSRRWHRPESWARVRVALALGVGSNPVARRLTEADALLDLSAGDSFTDLYGLNRLATVSEPKWAAMRAGRPVVLLPQTYGPFRTAAGRQRAERIVRGAALAYARDPRSYDNLLELAGVHADRTKLCQGVDVAFALEPRQPAPDVAEHLAPAADGSPTIGVNPSGLLQDTAGRTRFGLAADYLDTMAMVVRRLIAAGARVIFVPHVHVPGGGGESDLGAIQALVAVLTEAEREHVSVLPTWLDAAEVKWCIGQLDWFVGSRMHATIAALSTLTPATGYAYSDKTRGVFETCGVSEEVVDARHWAGPAAVEEIVHRFENRQATRRTLAEHVPATVEASRRQLADVLEAITRWRVDAAQVETIA